MSTAPAQGERANSDENKTTRGPGRAGHRGAIPQGWEGKVSPSPLPHTPGARSPTPAFPAAAGDVSARTRDWGSPRAAPTFFRSLTWPVMTAITYILMTSSALQSRKAGSTRPFISSRPEGSISVAAAAAAARGRERGQRARARVSPGARRGGESAGRLVCTLHPLTPSQRQQLRLSGFGRSRVTVGGLWMRGVPTGPLAPPHPSRAYP